jgi:hypothetical protein
VSHYNVELLTQAIEALRDTEEAAPEFVGGEHHPYIQVVSKALSRQLAEQVLILSGLAPQPLHTEAHKASVEERAGELLGVEDSSVLFDPDVTLSALERYRDQMAQGDEPEGYDYDDYDAYPEDELV